MLILKKEQVRNHHSGQARWGVNWTPRPTSIQHRKQANSGYRLTKDATYLPFFILRLVKIYLSTLLRMIDQRRIHPHRSRTRPGSGFPVFKFSAFLRIGAVTAILDVGFKFVSIIPLLNLTSSCYYWLKNQAIKTVAHDWSQSTEDTKSGNIIGKVANTLGVECNDRPRDERARRDKELETLRLSERASSQGPWQGRTLDSGLKIEKAISKQEGPNTKNWGKRL